MVKINFKIVLLFICFGFATSLYCNSLPGKKFVVVIDPGHGGNDPGAVGKISKEKDINLAVALEVGKLIEKNCSNTTVIYTRKKDVFISLNKRAEIANNAKADLFISIHTNAAAKNKTTIRGAETYTLGLARSAEKLEVAKRENGAILIEEDYQQRYEGFDPNSSESYIIFEFIQDKHMEQSVKLASMVQEQFKKHAKRIDCGVHQAGFLVLRSTAMPSILVELGYISHPEEEKYLNTKEGVNKLATGIYRAFLNYSNNTQKIPVTLTQQITTKENPKQQSSSQSRVQPQTKPKTTIQQSTESTPTIQKPIFKIQILASAKQLKKNDKEFKNLSPISEYKEKGIYKYTYTESEDYNQILKEKAAICSKFKDAFIVAFKNGKKIAIQEAISEFKKNHNNINKR